MSTIVEKEQIISSLRMIYDPEMPINIYDLGLIYDIEIFDGNVDITMTLTSPNCPVSELLPKQVQTMVATVIGVKKVSVILTFEPAWSPENLPEEVLLELGML